MQSINILAGKLADIQSAIKTDVVGSGMPMDMDRAP